MIFAFLDTKFDDLRYFQITFRIQSLTVILISIEDKYKFNSMKKVNISGGRGGGGVE